MADQLSASPCPGCGLRLPRDPTAHYDGYYHCSARLLQSLAAHYTNFPEFDLPPSSEAQTVFDVGLAADQLDHIERVKRWAAEVWRAW